MENKIRITKDGELKFFSPEEERFDLYKVVKKEDKWNRYDKKTRELLGQFDTEEEARQIFFVEKDVEDYGFSIFKCEVRIDEETTLANVEKALNSSELISFFIDAFYKDSNDFSILLPLEMKTNKKSNKTIIYREYCANDDRSITEDYYITNTPEHFSNNTIRLDETITLYYPDGWKTKNISGTMSFTLIDFLTAFYSNRCFLRKPVIIEKDKLYFKDNNEEIESDLTFLALLSPCEIAEGTTLHDIFKLVAKDDGLLEFIRGYGLCYNIEAYHEEADKSYESNEDETSIDFLEIKKQLEFTKSHYVHGSYVSAYSDFVGLCVSENFQRYALDLINLGKIKNLSVKLNTNFTVKEDRYNSDILVEGDKGFKLYEILDAIYDEISFYGTPVQRQETLEELEESVKDIESGVNKEEYKSYDSVKEMMKDIFDDEDDDWP